MSIASDFMYSKVPQQGTASAAGSLQFFLPVGVFDIDDSFVQITYTIEAYANGQVVAPADCCLVTQGPCQVQIDGETVLNCQRLHELQQIYFEKYVKKYDLKNVPQAVLTLAQEKANVIDIVPTPNQNQNYLNILNTTAVTTGQTTQYQTLSFAHFFGGAFKRPEQKYLKCGSNSTITFNTTNFTGVLGVLAQALVAKTVTNVMGVKDITACAINIYMKKYLTMSYDEYFITKTEMQDSSASQNYSKGIAQNELTTGNFVCISTKGDKGVRTILTYRLQPPDGNYTINRNGNAIIQDANQLSLGKQMKFIGNNESIGTCIFLPGDYKNTSIQVNVAGPDNAQFQIGTQIIIDRRPPQVPNQILPLQK